MADQEVVEKVCQIYADDGEKCAKVLENLSIEDAKCVGRENSPMWKMLKNLITFDQQFKYYCEKVVLSPDKIPSRPTTPANVEGLFTIPSHPGAPISPYELLPEPAPTAEAFIHWMFYLHDHLGKSTTICVHPHFFVTFRHGTHQQFNLGDTMKMYRVEKEVNEQIGIDVCVAKINESLDFVLLKSEVDVVDRGPMIAQARDSEAFSLAGFGNDQGCISYLNGIIHHVSDYCFYNDVRQMGPFILGTGQSRRGDSGGGIWGARGLIGMNFGCTTMPLQLHHEAISEAATFSTRNIICPAFHFKSAYVEELAKEFKKEEVTSPPRKKATVMTKIEGIGVLYGKEI